jgi:hypothetical protein
MAVGWTLDGLLRALFPRLSFHTTPVPDDAPWAMLAAHLETLVIEESFFGWMFLASGALPDASVTNGKLAAGARPETRRTR